MTQTSSRCVRCGAQTPDDAYVCHPEALSLAQSLRAAAGHAEDAQSVIARQTRYGTGARGGSGEPLPVDLTAADRYRAVENTIGTWARDLEADMDGLAAACRWLAGHVDRLRQHPAAGEAFDDLESACRQLERLVDRPADKELVGVCDCGRVLYAARGRQYVACPNPKCKLRWNVAESRGILAAALRGKLFTASECARLATFWHERTQPQIRALITTWTRPDRARLQAHGWIPNEDYTGDEDDDQPQGWATYLLGDVLDLLAQTPRRERRAA